MATLAAATATSLTWSNSGGTSGNVVPDHLIHGLWNVQYGAVANANITATNDGATFVYWRMNNAAGTIHSLTIGPTSVNQGMRTTATNNTAMEVIIRGFTDSVLGVGSNPVL